MAIIQQEETPKQAATHTWYPLVFVASTHILTIILHNSTEEVNQRYVVAHNLFQQGVAASTIPLAVLSAVIPYVHPWYKTRKTRHPLAPGVTFRTDSLHAKGYTPKSLHAKGYTTKNVARGIKCLTDSCVCMHSFRYRDKSARKIVRGVGWLIAYFCFYFPFIIFARLFSPSCTLVTQIRGHILLYVVVCIIRMHVPASPVTS